MKNLLIVLSTLLTLSANAQVGQPKHLFECDTNTDPDSLQVDVISAWGKVYAAIYEQMGDGDFYAEDMVELKYVDTGSDSTRTYKQVEGSKPQYPGMKMKRPSRKTRGVTLVIPVFGGKSMISAKADPLSGTSGSSPISRLPITCKSIVNAN